MQISVPLLHVLKTQQLVTTPPSPGRAVHVVAKALLMPMRIASRHTLDTTSSGLRRILASFLRIDPPLPSTGLIVDKVELK